MASSMYHIGKDGELYVSDGYETRKVAAPATPEPPPNLIYRGTLSEEDRAELRKPATPEPSEWKGETHVCPFCSATCAVGTFCTCERGQDEMRRWDTIMQAPAQSPLDRALEYFTTRRKAKREMAGIEEFFKGSQWGVHLESYPAQNEAVARAMSTPLPHDPDIHTRLMPYRSQSHDKQR